MADIRDAENAWGAALAMFMRFQQTAIDGWLGPLAQMQVGIGASTLTPEAKQFLGPDDLQAIQEETNVPKPEQPA